VSVGWLEKRVRLLVFKEFGEDLLFLDQSNWEGLLFKQIRKKLFFQENERFFGNMEKRKRRDNGLKCKPEFLKQ
jgi:hypothetical protein